MKEIILLVLIGSIIMVANAQRRLFDGITAKVFYVLIYIFAYTSSLVTIIVF